MFIVPMMMAMGASAATAATVSTVLSVAGTAMGVVGAVSSARAQKQAGKHQEEAAGFRAKQLDQQAGQERAVAQHQAIEARRRSGLAQSRAQALAASSGAGAVDPTVLNLVSGIAGEGELSAGNALYSGEERALGQETSASANRYEGGQARRAGEVRAETTIMGGVASAASSLSRYAPGPSPTAGANLASGYDGTWTANGPFNSATYDKQIWD
jgi:hypothetical protein